MSSQISIVRKFLSLYLDNKFQGNRTKIGKYIFHMFKSKSGDLNIGSFLEIKNNFLAVKTGKRISQNHVEFHKEYIDVTDIQELLDSDDTLLILKYGRVITDGNIIECFNMNNLYGNIFYNDFNEFFSL